MVFLRGGYCGSIDGKQRPEFEGYDNFTGEDYLTYISILKGMSKGEIRQKVDDMLKFVNLFEHRKEKVVNYFGGMKRRIGIAQAILNGIVRRGVDKLAGAFSREFSKEEVGNGTRFIERGSCFF